MAVTIFTNGQGTRQKKTVSSVRKRGESRDQQRNRTQDNSDIDAIFRGVNSTRGMVRRNMDGSIMDPNAPQGLDALYAKNPHLKGANERQQQYDQQRKDNFLPNVQSSIDAVKQQKGYTDEQGNFVPPTMPAEPFSPYGTGSVKLLPAWNKPRGTMPDPLTGKPVFMDEFLPALEKIQESKYGPGVRSYGQGVEKLPSKNKSFLPGQSSPPGGTSGARVGAPQVSGEPGGETIFGQLPAFQSEGMPQGIQYGSKQPVQQKGWESLFNVNKSTRMPPNAGPQYTPMMPNDGPQRPMDFGPQLPNSSAEQLMALKRLSGFGGNNNPTLTALEGTWSNIFPKVKDYEYLRQLFPGLVHPQAGAGQVMTELAKMYQNPAYQALFPNVNQSEFYR